MRILAIVLWLIGATVGYMVQAYVLARVGLDPLGVAEYALACAGCFAMHLCFEFGTALFTEGDKS